MSWTPEGRIAAVDSVLSLAPVLPVINILNLEQALPLARALVGAGLPVLEITLRTPVAIEAIRRIAAEVPEARVGAGTVLGAEDLAAVSAAGACFAISPGATAALYAAAESAPIPLIPGVASASDLMLGLEQGYRRFKLFPAAAAGGISALRGFAGPFPQVRFCPTGGIDAANAPAYLRLPNVITVGGSWMVPAEALAANDFARIISLARHAAEIGRAR